MTRFDAGLRIGRWIEFLAGLGTIVVHQNGFPRPIEIIKLTAFDRPIKNVGQKGNEQERQGNQQK